jgi:limonene-1,2-epoxide hydrolase
LETEAMDRPVGPRPIEVVEALVDSFESMDLDDAVSCLAADVGYTNVPIGTVSHHAGVREVLEPVFAPIEENELRIRRRVVAEEVVFLERLDRHRGAPGWRELPVNNVFELHDGNVTVWRNSFDLATTLKIHGADA